MPISIRGVLDICRKNEINAAPQRTKARLCQRAFKVMRYEMAAELVFDDLGDAAHGALFNAVAASDAGIFVLKNNNAAGDFKNARRASVYADAAANAFVGFKNRMRHDTLLLYTYTTGARPLRVPIPCTQDTIQ